MYSTLICTDFSPLDKTATVYFYQQFYQPKNIEQKFALMI
jgi:hypothetical protein